MSSVDAGTATATAASTSSVIASLVLVGVITILLMLCLWPSTAGLNPPHTADQLRQRQQQGSADVASGALHKSVSNREACTRTPSHVSAASASVAHSGGANLLSDGLIAFRHTKAATVVAALGGGEATATTTSLRKERAKILSQLLTTSESPPVKGGTVLVSLPERDVGCEKLARVLYALGTYYNLLVVIGLSSVNDEDNDSNMKKDDNLRTKQESLLQRLRCNTVLPVTVLPDHRVMLAATTTGRVALARQLQRVELILEFDNTVKQQLARFGHSVVLYNSNNNIKTPTTTTTAASAVNCGGVSVSPLGQLLL